MKIQKINKLFQNFDDFRRKMQNKVYFTETKPEVFTKNPQFKLKSNFLAETQYKEIKVFG